MGRRISQTLKFRCDKKKEREMSDKKSVPGNKMLVVDDQIGIVSFLYDFFKRKEF